MKNFLGVLHSWSNVIGIFLDVAGAPMYVSTLFNSTIGSTELTGFYPCPPPLIEITIKLLNAVHGNHPMKTHQFRYNAFPKRTAVVCTSLVTFPSNCILYRSHYPFRQTILPQHSPNISRLPQKWITISLKIRSSRHAPEQL